MALENGTRKKSKPNKRNIFIINLQCIVNFGGFSCLSTVKIYYFPFYCLASTVTVYTFTESSTLASWWIIYYSTQLHNIEIAISSYILPNDGLSAENSYRNYTSKFLRVHRKVSLALLSKQANILVVFW